MKTEKLSAKQIITLNDFPVYNEHILKIFFRIFQKGCGKIIPPCPVIHKKLVVSSFNTKLLQEFKKFESKNKSAKYFLLDGSHKTTAANLTNKKIKVILIKKDKDIGTLKKLVDSGELFSLTVSNTIEDNVKDLIKHFTKEKGFQTVEEKTQKMIKKEVIPKFMIKYYKTHKRG